MVLGAAAHIAHGEAELVGGDRGVGDAGRGGSHDDLGLGVLLPYDLGYALLDVLAHLGVGQGEAVVAVDGALDARSPGEGLIGTEEDRLDAEQVLGDGCLVDHELSPWNGGHARVGLRQVGPL